MKILFYDCETSPNIAYSWAGKFEVDIIDFIEEGHIICFAYKWLGDKSVRAFSLDDFKGNKKKLIEKLHEILDQADVCVAHNGTSFDFKWANREFAFHGLPPAKPFKVIDTLTIARNKFNFNSNKLDDLGQFLGVGRKMKHDGFPLWKACMAGDKKAFKKMVAYNKIDVVLLEKIYNRLVPFANNIPQIQFTGMNCPFCGSENIQKRGWAINKVFMSQRYSCMDCGRWALSSNKIKHQTEEYVK